MRWKALPVVTALVLAAHLALAWRLLQAFPPDNSLSPLRPGAVLTLVAVREPVSQTAHRLGAIGPAAAVADGHLADVGQMAKPDVVAPSEDKVARLADVQPPPPADDPTLAPTQRFFAPDQIDRAALPRLAPDLAIVQGLSWSGYPIRLRLFIDASGSVVDVSVLRTNESDDVIQRLRQMFMSTPFIPARAQGADVASYKDIEVNFTDPH